MKTPIFTGSSVAVVTPFNESGINFKEFAKIVDFQIENNCKAITVCGTTGEKSTLSDKEHKALVSFCIQHVSGRVPVIAGTGSNDTAYAIQNSKFAAKEGADAILSVTPYYNKTSQAGLIKHFQLIAEECECPLILYNVPSRTGMGITPNSYLELSKHPNINGTKEASGNFSLIAEAMALCGDNFNFWSGNDDQIVPLMALGAKGVISVLSNILPCQTEQIVDLCLNCDFKNAAALQFQYLELINALFCDVNPIPVKAAMSLMGFDTKELRMPLYPISDKNLEILKLAMKNVGLI